MSEQIEETKEIEKEESQQIEESQQTEEPKQAEEPEGSEKVEANAAEFDEFDEFDSRNIQSSDKLDFLKDLQLNVFIELGRTQMQIKDILELERGYVIELDKLASEPVDIYVNNKKIAEGEVVVIDKHFGVRITNLIDVNSRLKGLT